jgi:hypothetical protein
VAAAAIQIGVFALLHLAEVVVAAIGEEAG